MKCFAGQVLLNSFFKYNWFGVEWGLTTYVPVNNRKRRNCCVFSITRLFHFKLTLNIFKVLSFLCIQCDLQNNFFFFNSLFYIFRTSSCMNYMVFRFREQWHCSGRWCSSYGSCCCRNRQSQYSRKKRCGTFDQ